MTKLNDLLKNAYNLIMIPGDRRSKECTGIRKRQKELLAGITDEELPEIASALHEDPNYLKNIRNKYKEQFKRTSKRKSHKH
jgi:hypothetical protein